jgi:lipopolysaccharide/colanic/teichoic acid biosynthesis glycosyltransferase
MPQPLMAKRLFDVLLAAAGLSICLPLILIIALAIKLDSSGGVIFRQIRVGRFGRPFSMFKFRTMSDSPNECGPLITRQGDPRITSVGAFLRRTKLDELPQLVNVLRGDMSLVGPRPEVPKYVAMYPDELAPIVLSVRPGITDEAAIEFRNEEVLLAGSTEVEAKYVREILPRKLDMYVRYVEQRSFTGDLRILLRTLRSVICG